MLESPHIHGNCIYLRSTRVQAPELQNLDIKGPLGEVELYIWALCWSASVYGSHVDFPVVRRNIWEYSIQELQWDYFPYFLFGTSK